VNDPLDENRYKERETAPRVPPPRDVASFPEDDPADLIIRDAPFPGVILAAGILWIVDGAIFVGLFGLFQMLQIPLQTSEFLFLGGAFFFIFDGIRLIMGRFRDPLGDAILSIGTGVVVLGMSAFYFHRSAIVFMLISGAFFAGILIAPGILALVGRSRYLAWRARHGR